MGGWSHRRQFGRASPEPGGGERKKGWQNGSEHVCFLGRCDASDVNGGEDCIISTMRDSGGNANSLLPGVGVHVDDRSGDAKTGWTASRKGDARLWLLLKSSSTRGLVEMM